MKDFFILEKHLSLSHCPFHNIPIVILLKILNCCRNRYLVACVCKMLLQDLKIVRNVSVIKLSTSKEWVCLLTFPWHTAKILNSKNLVTSKQLSFLCWSTKQNQTKLSKMPLLISFTPVLLKLHSLSLLMLSGYLYLNNINYIIIIYSCVIFFFQHSVSLSQKYNFVWLKNEVGINMCPTFEFRPGFFVLHIILHL